MFKRRHDKQPGFLLKSLGAAAAIHFASQKTRAALFQKTKPGSEFAIFLQSRGDQHSQFAKLDADRIYRDGQGKPGQSCCGLSAVCHHRQPTSQSLGESFRRVSPAKKAEKGPKSNRAGAEDLEKKRVHVGELDGNCLGRLPQDFCKKFGDGFEAERRATGEQISCEKNKLFFGGKVREIGKK